MHGSCHTCFPKSCCDGKQALLVLLVGGVCKFNPAHVSEVRGGGGGKLLVAISLGIAWDISRIKLPRQSVLTFNSKSEDCAKRVRV